MERRTDDSNTFAALLACGVSILSGPVAVDPRLAEADAAKVASAMTPLQRIAPDPGSYVYESNYFNARRERAFWGENHARLLRVKRRYDPDGLFIVHHGIGNGDWSPDGFRPMG